MGHLQIHMYQDAADLPPPTRRSTRSRPTTPIRDIKKKEEEKEVCMDVYKR